MPKVKSLKPKANLQGWQGWDAYAPFYDWENAQTLDRRDVGFWRSMAMRANGPILELGCGTGRVTLPVARVGARTVGIDRSEEMLSYARRRARRAKLRNLSFVRGDIRSLPFLSSEAGAPKRGRFDLVIAPYGILQSLVRESDLKAALEAVAGVLSRDGVFALDLVPDLPAWKEYRDQVRFRGQRRGSRSRITLVESVRQDRRRGLTIFDQQYVERRGREKLTSNFSLTFRTVSVPQMIRRLEHAGFRVGAVLGDYHGKPWDPRADVWLVLAHKC